MQAHRLLFFPALLLFAVACNPASAPATAPVSKTVSSTIATTVPTVVSAVPGAASTRTVPPSPTVEPTLAPNPLTVKMNTDPKLSASAVISETGGTIRTQGADGTRFTLDLPPGAVDQATKITVTPLSSVEGLPLSGGLVAGVNLEPDGLSFGRPVTLTVEMASPMSSGGYEAIAFAAQGGGNEFHLYPSRMEGQRITMLLAHFSPRGVGKGTPADIAKQKREHAPSNPIDRLHQNAAGRQERALLIKQMTNAYLYVESQIDHARTDAEMEAAWRAYADWMMAILTLDVWDELKENFDLADSLFAARVKELVNQLAQQCASQNDLTQIGVLLKWHRRATPGSGWSFAHWLDEAAKKEMQDNVDRCLSFELNFDSTLTARAEIKGGVLIVFPSHLYARVPVQFSSGPGESEADAPLLYLSFKPTYTTPPPTACYLNGIKAGDGTLRVLLPSLSANSSGTGFPDIRLYLELKLPDELIESVTCTTPASSTTQPMGARRFYIPAFGELHQEEIVNGAYRITGWEPGDGKAFAKKIYNRSGVSCFAGIQVCSETTTLELFHTPPK